MDGVLPFFALKCLQHILVLLYTGLAPPHRKCKNILTPRYFSRQHRTEKCCPAGRWSRISHYLWKACPLQHRLKPSHSWVTAFAFLSHGLAAPALQRTSPSRLVVESIPTSPAPNSADAKKKIRKCALGLVKCSVKMLILSALSVEDCFWLVMSLDVFQRWKLKLVKAVAHNLNSNDSLEGYPDLDTPNCENALGWMLFFQTTRSKHKLIDSLTVSKQPWKTLRKSGWAKNLEDRHGRLHVFFCALPKASPF